MPRHNQRNNAARNRQKKAPQKKKFTSPKQYEHQNYAQEYDNTDKNDQPIFGFVSKPINKKPRQQPVEIAIEMFGSTYITFELYTLKGQNEKVSN